MFHPFLDTSKLTDEELMSKLSNLYGILSHQEQMGHSEMYQNVLNVIHSIEAEQQKRMSDAMIQQDIENSKNLEFGEVTNELGINYDEEL